jgi:hypothetical protein
VYSTTEAVLKDTKFLQDNAKTFFSFTSTGVRIDDNFAELLILEITGDRSVQMQFPHSSAIRLTKTFSTLVDLEMPANTW